MGGFFQAPTFANGQTGIPLGANGTVLTVVSGALAFAAAGGGVSGLGGAYITAAAAAGANNDFNPGGAPAWPGGASTPYGFLDLTPPADCNLTGLVAGLDKQQLVIRNNSAFNITLNNQNAGSAAANQFAIGIGDLILGAGVSISAVYYATIARWAVAP